MAIQYVTRQDRRKNGNQLWYGRAIHPATVNLETIAERIQRNCSMTKGDVLAVLTEMVSVMRDELQNSNKVKIDGLGLFAVNIRTKGATAEEDFTARDNIKHFTVNFQVERKLQNGKYTRTFTEGLSAVKAGTVAASKANAGA